MQRYANINTNGVFKRETLSAFEFNEHEFWQNTFK